MKDPYRKGNRFIELMAIRFSAAMFFIAIAAIIYIILSDAQ
jgi:hypothetical protein